MSWDNVWPPDWDQLWSDAQAGEPWVLIAGSVIGVLLIVGLVLFVLRSLRARDFDAKANIGFGVVQLGVAFITITGGFEFFHRLLKMPSFEAGLLAGFIEACVWAAVGSIYSHGRGVDNDGKPNTGFGPAGGFFWTTVCGGGLLAILGSESVPVAIGRIVVVVLGAYMWYLRLLRATRPSSKPSRLRWTPKAFLLLIGAIVPGDEDVQDEAREWQVRKMARSIRWANSGHQPWAWLGGRALVKSAEQVQEDVLAEARRRYAAAYLLRTQIAPSSPVMASLLDSLQREALGEPPVPQAQDTMETLDLETRLAAVEQLLRQPAGEGPGGQTNVLDAGQARTVPAARRAAATSTLPDTARLAEEDRAAEAGSRRATTAPMVPRTAGSFQQWLTIWDDMQTAPSTTNAELAERHKVAERTITNIRRAGKEGLLTREHLHRLQGGEASMEPATPAPGDNTGPTASMTAVAADEQEPPAGLPAAPEAPAPQPPAQSAPVAGEHRERDEALVG